MNVSQHQHDTGSWNICIFIFLLTATTRKLCSVCQELRFISEPVNKRFCLLLQHQYVSVESQCHSEYKVKNIMLSGGSEDV